MVRDGVTEASRAVDLAESVDGADHGIGLGVVRERVLQAANHGDAGNGRVDGQEDVVEDDKGEEGTRLGDPPGLVAMLAIVPVDVGDGDEVDGGDGQRDLVGEGALVDVGGDGEGIRKRRLAVPRGRNGKGRWVWGELEDSS